MTCIIQISTGIKCDLRGTKSLTRTQDPTLFWLFFPLYCLSKWHLKGPSSCSPCFKSSGKYVLLPGSHKADSAVLSMGSCLVTVYLYMLNSFSHVQLFATLWSVCGILQARILEWVAMPFSEDLPDPGIKRTSASISCTAADSLPTEPPRKPHLVTMLTPK